MNASPSLILPVLIVHFPISVAVWLFYYIPHPLLLSGDSVAACHLAAVLFSEACLAFMNGQPLSDSLSSVAAVNCQSTVSPPPPPVPPTPRSKPAPMAQQLFARGG